jgi:hypothetical protein
MNITIFPTGKGGAESAVKYLLSDTDHEKKKRSVLPEILFGDPNTFTEIANATKRQHKYTSGVIAFRDGLESQSVTPEQITTLIETFRATFLPGLKVDENFADFWVMHRVIQRVPASAKYSSAWREKHSVLQCIFSSDE